MCPRMHTVLQVHLSKRRRANSVGWSLAPSVVTFWLCDLGKFLQLSELLLSHFQMTFPKE